MRSKDTTQIYIKLLILFLRGWVYVPLSLCMSLGLGFSFPLRVLIKYLSTAWDILGLENMGP